MLDECEIDFSGQIIAIVPAVVKTQTLFSSHGGLLAYAMFHHRSQTCNRKKGSEWPKRRVEAQYII